MTYYCCWNIGQGKPTHNDDCLAAFGPKFMDADLAVTFTDGATIIYKNVRVCINKPDDDGINVIGTTIEFETMDVSFTAVGVRYFTYTLND